jgi:hypothetical protein
MKKINLKKIMENNDLDVTDLAKQLFPGNKYPKLAINRVLSGAALLDANQISKLALILDVDISKLFDGGNWKMSTKNSCHTFLFKEFKAEFNTKDWTTKIYYNESLFHESILHTHSIVLSEYLAFLDKQVQKFKENE